MIKKIMLVDDHQIVRAGLKQIFAECTDIVVDVAGARQRSNSSRQRGQVVAQQIRTHMALNLCRCGTHMRILRAIRRAADKMAGTA